MLDRRKFPRLRSLKSAQIVFHRHWPPIDCVVRNFTAHGACLEMQEPSNVPLTFDVMFTQGLVKRPSRQVWRSETQIGVAFG